jgi:glyoxylase-like metal-dependent hydrolase (beta-lactamase superfamily II)
VQSVLVWLGVCALAGSSIVAQQGVQSLRLYVLDCGDLGGASPLAVPVYLVVHPRGSLLWEAGTLPDSLVESGGSTENLLPNIRRAKSSKTLRSQLAQIGYTPDRITYFALSHYHDDHTANANDYRGSTWLVQKAERDAMFTDPPPRFADASFYSALKDSKTVVINNTDHDVFGDGSVVLKFAPGHTPGHQMLLLRLPKTGLVLLSGDIYHLPGEREKLTEIPTSDSNRDVSLVTRPAIEAFIKQSGATLWIQHDMALFKTLKKSPEYYE